MVERVPAAERVVAPDEAAPRATPAVEIASVASQVNAGVRRCEVLVDKRQAIGPPQLGVVAPPWEP